MGKNQRKNLAVIGCDVMGKCRCAHLRERERCDWWGQRLRKILRKKHETSTKTFAFPCWLCSLNKWPYSIGYATNIVGRGPQHFKTRSGWDCRLHFHSLTSIGLVLALYIGLILAHIYKAKERKKMIVFPLISFFLSFFIFFFFFFF